MSMYTCVKQGTFFYGKQKTKFMFRPRCKKFSPAKNMPWINAGNLQNKKPVHFALVSNLEFSCNSRLKRIIYIFVVNSFRFFSSKKKNTFLLTHLRACKHPRELKCVLTRTKLWPIKLIYNIQTLWWLRLLSVLRRWFCC